MTINFNEAWTEARISRLTHLWATGLSCTQIAADLGGGLSRSAVIGKIYRLKLPVPVSKNSTMARSHVIVRQARPTPPPAPRPSRIASQSRSPDESFGTSKGFAAVNAVRRVERLEQSPGLPERLTGEGPDGTGIKLMDLTPRTCRWPRGNPTEPDFEFCGGKALPDLPYCSHHSRMAYQPPRARAAADKWSLHRADIQS